MDYRTDLALERAEICGIGKNNGIEKSIMQYGDSTVTKITVTNENGEKLIGKPKGKYITVDVPSFYCDSELLDGRLDGLVEQIVSLIPENGTVLTIGLGNRNMTADALGPLCAEKIFVTRHIGYELAKASGLENLRSVASVVPGVLGNTGIESAEIVKSLADNLKPSCIVTIDALAALDFNRLGSTVQLTDTGISPGSGIGNTRKEISKNTLGIPVIAIGVPTVISAYTLAENVLDELDINADISKGEKFKEFIVASREADLICERASKFIALALNCAFQKHISPQDLMMLM